MPLEHLLAVLYIMWFFQVNCEAMVCPRIYPFNCCIFNLQYWIYCFLIFYFFYIINLYFVIFRDSLFI